MIRILNESIQQDRNGSYKAQFFVDWVVGNDARNLAVFDTYDQALEFSKNYIHY